MTTMRCDRDLAAVVPRRVADVQLRGLSGPVRATMYWPAATGTAPSVLVLFGAEARAAYALCRSLCCPESMVVLSVGLHPAAVRDAVAVTEWVADHAAELDAEPERTLIGGERAGGRLATKVARYARDAGWPPIARRALLHTPDWG